jgi:hypothetical protein
MSVQFPNVPTRVALVRPLTGQIIVANRDQLEDAHQQRSSRRLPPADVLVRVPFPVEGEGKVRYVFLRSPRSLSFGWGWLGDDASIGRGRVAFTGYVLCQQF